MSLPVLISSVGARRLLLLGSLGPRMTFARAQTSAFASADGFDPDVALVTALNLGAAMTFTRAQTDAFATGDAE